MRVDTGNLGTDSLFQNTRHERAKGLLKRLPLGLILACRSAYASPHRMPVSNVVSDSVIDWGLAIFIIIIAMFITLVVVDAKKNGR